jgi:hypothetical protein
MDTYLLASETQSMYYCTSYIDLERSTKIRPDDKVTKLTESEIHFRQGHSALAGIHFTPFIFSLERKVFEYHKIYILYAPV